MRAFNFNRVVRGVRRNPAVTAVVLALVVVAVVTLVWNRKEGLGNKPVIPPYNWQNAPLAPPGKVIMYYDAYYQGQAAPPAGVGRYPTIGVQDAITSVKVGKGVTLTVYQHPNFGGNSLTLAPGNHANLGWFPFTVAVDPRTGQVRPSAGNLCKNPNTFGLTNDNSGCWNDTVSSFVIAVDTPLPVLVYDTNGFKMGSGGAPGKYYRGAPPQLNKWGWEDRIASVVVPPGRVLTLYEHGDFTGKRLRLEGGRHDLSHFKFGDYTRWQPTRQCNSAGRDCWSGIASSAIVG